MSFAEMAEKMANVEAGYASVVQVEGDIHIDATSVSRSVYVTGYRPTTTWEDLVIHFQRKRNGGGEIDNIVISKPEAAHAVITFERPEGKMFILDGPQCLSRD